MNINGSTYFYIPDIQGSIRAIVDINGNLMASYVYDVWGTLVSYNGTLAQKNDYLYTAREYDWETGVYYYRARSYDAELGRFLQQDPEGMVDGPNMFVYVGNDPGNNNDYGGTALKYIGIPCIKSWHWWGISWGHLYFDKSSWQSCVGFTSISTGAGYQCLLGTFLCLFWIVFGVLGVTSFLVCIAYACGAYAIMSFYCGISALRCL